MPYKVKLLSPAVTFLDGLPDRFRSKVGRSIGLVREFGPYLREPHSKKVSDRPGLFELRVVLGREACRLFYFWHERQFYVVTSGYMKKAMKLQRSELEKASVLMERFLNSTGGANEGD